MKAHPDTAAKGVGPAGLAVVLAALAGVACGRGETPTTHADGEAPPVNVTVTTLEPEAIAETVELSADLEPWVEVRVATEQGGSVRSVSFDKGDHVAAGAELARVGTDLFQAALDEADAVLLGAEAQYTKAEELFKREAIPRQELLDATSTYRAAQARVEQARLRLERSVLRAPIAGTAVTRDLEPGEFLAPGAPVTTLHRVDRLKAVAGVPEADIGFVTEGDVARVRIEGLGEFEGRVHHVGSAATGLSRTFPVEIRLDNGDGRLRPGMIGAVRLVRRRFDSAIVVRRDALMERDQGVVAAVLEGDVARIRPVTLGATQGDRVLVAEGLAAGDRLIVTGHRGLSDGQRVAVVGDDAS